MTLLFVVSFLVSFGQNQKPYPAERFIGFLNNYQVDSLQTLVADNFELKRTYTTYNNNRKSFFEKYIPYSKNLNGKFKILKANKRGQTTSFLVEDQSDYLKYLNIDYPKWHLQIIINEQDKIVGMTVDTTENYQTYLKQSKKMSEQFDNWLKKKYPDETTQILHNTVGLFIRRLKEYSSQ